MSGHGHVTPNADGLVARCGGPAICKECALELAQKTAAEKAQAIKSQPRAVGLVDVYDSPEAARDLYALLAERRQYQAISHKVMPTFEEHCAFIARRPYAAWYLIKVIDTAEAPFTAGATYLTKAREVGLFVLEAQQGRGIGDRALHYLRMKHPGRLLANIAPANERSRRFFERRGFKLIQKTYELPA